MPPFPLIGMYDESLNSVQDVELEHKEEKESLKEVI